MIEPKIRKIANAVRKARAATEERAASKARSTAAEKMPGRGRLAGEGLDGPHGTDRFRGEGGGVGERVLGKARAAAHRATEGDERQDDDRDRGDDDQGQAGAGDHHHRDRPEEQDGVAQGERGGGADRRPDLRRVGRQARDDLTGQRLVVEGRRQPRQMGEDIVADIRYDTLAEGDDEIVTAGAGDRENCRQHHQHGEISVDETRAARREAVVDDPAHGQRQGKRGERGERQEDDGRDDLGLVAGHVWKKAGEGLQIAPFAFGLSIDRFHLTHTRLRHALHERNCPLTQHGANRRATDKP